LHEILDNSTLCTRKLEEIEMAKGISEPVSNLSRTLTLLNSFVEFETGAILKDAIEKLDGREFKGATVHCIADVRRSS